VPALGRHCVTRVASSLILAQETILRTAIDVWPSDKDAAAVERIWLFERFDAVDGDELYDCYLRLCDKINRTDLADLVPVVKAN
jgi:hypothetical protein